MATRQEATATTRIVVPGAHSMVALLGSSDELLRLVEHAFTCDIHVRGNEITISGDQAEVDLAARLFEELITLLERGDVLTADAVQRSLAMLRQQTEERPADVLSLNILSSRGRTIRPKTLNQKRYVDAIDEHTIVFGIGPAGTGKTYLAMAKAVQALQAKQVNRIILTRPEVEAGERLGFLPGTLSEKIDPYLRPLYDALHDMVDPDSIPRLMASGTIEVAPLAYMRGRAQPVDTPVLTPWGWQPIGDLRPGDLVTGSNGAPTVVLGVYSQGRKPVHRVTTSDGASTLACGEHLWQVSPVDDCARGLPPRVVQTQEMAADLHQPGAPRYALPLVGPVQFSPRPTQVDAYSLGLQLSPGCDGAGPHTTAGVQRHLGGGVAVARRTATGVVPADYLVNSVEVRLAVLQALLDADGTPVRHDGASRIHYFVGSQALRDDVTFLVRSLGGVAHAVTAATDAGEGLDIRLPSGIEPFRLSRKRDAYADGGSGRPVRIIDGIEPAGEAECVCIAVAAADSLYVTEDFLVTHNTLNDSFIVLDEAQNTSAEQMKMFLTRLGFGSKMVVTGDVTQIDLPTGTRSGLKIVQEILDGIEDVHFSRLTSSDVVRHRLVSDIVDAYAKWDADNTPSPGGSRPTGGTRRRNGR